MLSSIKNKKTRTKIKRCPQRVVPLYTINNHLKFIHMETYITSIKDPTMGASINRLANIAMWYFQEHPDMRDARNIIQNDLIYIAQHIG